MRPSNEVYIFLHLSFVFTVFRSSEGKDHPDHPQAAEQNYNDNYGYNSNSDTYNYANPIGGDYGTTDTDDDSPYQHSCYTCTFQVFKGHPMGMEGCRDPFKAEEVPSVTCSAPCQKMYHKMGESDWLLTRQCTPNCKEIRDETKYVECCSERLCNTSARCHSWWTLTALCLALVIAWQQAVLR